MMRLAAEATQQKHLSVSSIFSLWDADFIGKTNAEVCKLDPLCDYIDFVQSRECSLAEAVHKWLEMDFILGNFSKWEKGNTMICELPAILAYSLHPKFKGELLSPTQWVQVKSQIYRKGEATYQEFESFIKEEKGFGDEFLKKTKPEIYWKTMKIEFPLIADIALTYLPLPASTASLERVFSMWSHVHSKTRNRLSSKTSEKLIFCYHSLKNMNKEKLMSLYNV